MSIVNGFLTLKIKTVHFRLSDLASLEHAVMNGTIENISLDFVLQRLPERSVTCVRIPGSELVHNMNTHGAQPKFRRKGPDIKTLTPYTYRSPQQGPLGVRLGRIVG